MLSFFKSNESKDTCIATERLTEDSKHILLDNAAKNLQQVVNWSNTYCPSHKISALHNSLNQLKSVYSMDDLDRGIWIYGNYYYQRQTSGRFDVITR